MASQRQPERAEPRSDARFRVHFRGGSTVLVIAANSLKAEQEAIRCHAGQVRKVEYLGKVRS